MRTEGGPWGLRAAGASPGERGTCPERLRHLAAAERALVPAALRHGSIAALPTERGAPETRTCVLPAAAPALLRPRSQVWAYKRACYHDHPPPTYGGLEPLASNSYRNLC